MSFSFSENEQEESVSDGDNEDNVEYDDYDGDHDDDECDYYGDDFDHHEDEADDDDESESRQADHNGLLEAKDIIEIIRNGDRLDYDIGNIVKSAADSWTIPEVVSCLFRHNADTYWSVIKEFMEQANIELKDLSEHGDSVEEKIQKAISDDDDDTFEFFINHGLDVDDYVDDVVRADAMDILMNHMETANINENTVDVAIENQRAAILSYIMKDNSDLANYALKTALEEKNDEMTREIIDTMLDIDDACEWVDDLLSENNIRPFSVIFDAFEDLREPLEVFASTLDLSDFKRVLQCASTYLATARELDQKQIFALLSTFTEKRIREIQQIYCKEFKGCDELQTIRHSLLNDIVLDEEPAFDIYLIGVAFSTSNRYFTSTPYNPTPPEESERYFRSSLYNISGIASTKMKNARDNVHRGLISAPQDRVLIERRAEMSTESRTSQSLHSAPVPEPSILPYDLYLQYRNKICKFITEEYSIQSHPCASNAIGVFHYNNYPCLMVHIRPWAEGIHLRTKTDSWTNYMISVFVGLSNYISFRSGYDIELVRRSSFGFLTPTLAPCGNSMRISVGLIPQAYCKDVLVPALCIMEKMLDEFNHIKSDDSRIQLPTNHLFLSAAYRDYIGGNSPIHNLLDLRSSKAERANGSSAIANITRTALFRDAISLTIYTGLKTGNVDVLDSLLYSLRWTVNQFQLVKGRLTKLPVLTPHSVQRWSLEPMQFLTEVEFFECVDDLTKGFISWIKSHYHEQVTISDTESIVSTRLQTHIRQCNLNGLHYELQLFNEVLCSRIVFTDRESIDNAFGSDSEIDDELSPIFARKLIVRNGMRAIVAAIEAALEYCGTNADRLLIHASYYEVAIVLQVRCTKARSKSEFPLVLFEDANALVSNGVSVDRIPELERTDIKITIVDTTSATVARHRQYVQEFNECKSDALMFVSSGFKNEQFGADKNPYGTIRIFTKSKSVRERLIDVIKRKEEPIKSNFSHHYRRLMKNCGFVPTNKIILKF